MGHKMDHQLAVHQHHHHHHHHHVGNKVLPITESNVSSARSSSATTTKSTTTTQDDHQKKDSKVVKSIGSTTSADNNKIKAITRMKLELLRWAAAAKQQSSQEKGAPKTPSFLSRKVAYLRNKGNIIKAIRSSSSTTGLDDIVDDVGSLSSPKISFKWDVISSCSAYSTMSLPCSSSISTSRINHSDRRLSTKETTFALPALDDENNNQLCPSRFGNWITTDDEFVVLELRMERRHLQLLAKDYFSWSSKDSGWTPLTFDQQGL